MIQKQYPVLTTMGKILFFTMAVFLTSTALHAQTRQPDTLIFRYRHIAVQYQQQVKRAMHNLAGARSELNAVKSAMAPHVDFNSNFSYYGVPLKLAPKDGALTGENLHNLYSMDLTLTQPIVNGGLLKNSKRLAESKIEAMQYFVNLNKQQVMFTADQYYWTAVAKKEIFRLSEAYRDVIGQFVKVIQDKVEEEVTGKNELYQARVRYNDAEYQTIRSGKDFRISVMGLNRLLGFPIDSMPLLRDSLPRLQEHFSGDSMVQKALAFRPEIGYLKSRIQMDTYNEKLTASKYNVHLGVLAGGKWGAPSPGLDINPGFNYYLKASLIVPVFYWGEKKNAVFATRQQTENTKLQMQETTDKVILEVQQGYYNLVKSQKQMNFAIGALDNAKRNVSVMLDRYNEGLSSVLDVLDAQTYWQKSYFNYIQAKYELNMAYSQYKRALGQLKDAYK